MPPFVGAAGAAVDGGEGGEGATYDGEFAGAGVDDGELSKLVSRKDSLEEGEGWGIGKARAIRYARPRMGEEFCSLMAGR